MTDSPTARCAPLDLRGRFDPEDSPAGGRSDTGFPTARCAPLDLRGRFDPEDSPAGGRI
jgi:hypothetical protein